jgi:hydrogenase expression/formation protein HypC
MCLTIPGKVISIGHSSGLRLGNVDFGGTVRLASLDLVPEAQVGDYVMVHVGFAIRRVEAEEAERTYKLVDETGGIESDLPRKSSG